MKRITKDELEVFLRKHKLWLVCDSEGERADLRGANLRGANLIGADLSEANLNGADLYEADLYGAYLNGAYLNGAYLNGADLYEADLSEANLNGADLYEADLSEANLYGADLRGANLIGADLSEANLNGADLYEADLYGAYLSEANLYGADLSEANLNGADLRGAKNLRLPIACPEEGSFVGFKKCQNNLIVKLEISADALRCSATGRKCRCSEAKVVSITKLDGSSADVDSVVSKYDSNFIYRIGETVKEPNFNPDRWNECSAGIHFFITRQEAVEYNY